MIVKTIDQIKKVLTTLDSEIEFSEFEPYVKDAEDWMEADVLGTVLYDKVDGALISDDKLFRLCENVIVLKAYEEGIPYMDVVQTEMGFGVISDKNKTPASQQRVQKLIDGNKIRLDKNIERLINYLEDTAAYHTDWKSSSAFTLLSDCLITTAREFKRFVSFDGNRSDFMLLRPTMLNMTSIYLFPNISKAYSQELILKQNAGTLNDADKAILPGLKQAIANFVMQNDNMAKVLLTDVINVIENDLDSYPTYRDSAEKLVKDTAGYQNTEESPIFVSP